MASKVETKDLRNVALVGHSGTGKTGLAEALLFKVKATSPIEKGVVAGYPVVDVEVEVYDGSYHDVDSGPASFELAGSKAFKDAFAKAKPVLLEPIVVIEIAVPSKFMGEITGDLNSRRGRIQGMDSRGTMQVVRASIPMMEIMDYETQLRSVTGGEGSYSIEPSHYDVLPARIADAMIAKARKPMDEEE